MSDNSQHPEAGEGEIFLRNASELYFSTIPLGTKRLGHVAYGEDGNRLQNGLRPVFVERAEFIAPYSDRDGERVAYCPPTN